MQEPNSITDPGHDSATESASSRDTWPTEPNQSDGGGAAGVAAKAAKEKELANGVSELQVSREPSLVGRMSLREVARERVDLVAEKMKILPEEHLEEVKNELKSILESGGPRHVEEFMYLQKLVHDRVDLTPNTLSVAHHMQLEILVVIKTGILGFLHPSVSIPQSRLVEVFLFKRCRNIACQSDLPAEDCRCNICASRGFCNLCMCVICSKFDFVVNTCHWLGCDFCSHWTHTDCAIHSGQIGMGQSVKSSTGHAEMLFRCRACQRTSKLLGWVKDAFQECAPSWDRDAMLKELEYVCKIFRLSEDRKGRILFRKCAELIERLRNTRADSINPRMIQHVLQELEMDSPKNTENEDPRHPVTPQEAGNRIAEAVQEAVRKMELVALEKMRLQKNQRPSQASGSSSGAGDPAQTMMLSKIEDLLKNVRSIPPKSEGQ